MPKVITGAILWKRLADAQLQAKDVSDDMPHGGLEGYLAVFNNVDQGGERILPGAFKKTIRDGRRDGWPLMTRHIAHGGDAADVVGTIFEAKEDDKGLFVRARFAETRDAQDIRSKVAGKHVRGLSVGYRLMRWEESVEGDKAVLNLKEMQLIEGTITVSPMNLLAGVTGSKSAEAIETRLRELESKVEKILSVTSDAAGTGSQDPVASTCEADASDDSLPFDLDLEIERLKSHELAGTTEAEDRPA